MLCIVPGKPSRGQGTCAVPGASWSPKWLALLVAVAVVALLPTANAQASELAINSLTTSVDQSTQATGDLKDSTDTNTQELVETVNTLKNITQALVNSNDENVRRLELITNQLSGTVTSSIQDIDRIAAGVSGTLNNVATTGTSVTASAERLVGVAGGQVDKVLETVTTTAEISKSMFEQLNTTLNALFAFVTVWVVIIAITCVAGCGQRQVARGVDSLVQNGLKNAGMRP